MSLDLAHFDSLRRLLELERAAERERRSTEAKTLPLGELEARGLVVLDVETKDSHAGLGGRSILKLVRFDRAPLKSRLWSGDVVTASPRKTPVEDPPSGVVVSCTRHEITVAFDRPAEFVFEGRLRLDVVPNDATFERARNALARVAAMDKGVERTRREILLGNQPPRFDHRRSLTDAPALNEEQRAAVAMGLSATDFALVHGPPGTGKSTVLKELAARFGAEGLRLLCTAASNAAVDHLLELCLDAGLRAVRVGHPARVLPHLTQHTLDELVENHPDRKIARELMDEAFDLLGYARNQKERGRSRARFANAREAQAEARKLLDEARALERKVVAGILSNADVVCSTLATLEGHTLGGEKFDVALFDEATQATEPLSLLAFLKAPRVIMAGDPMQLPPTVISEKAAREGLARSLFERLLETAPENSRCLLKEQHRMNERLMFFPSKQMYQGALRAHPAVAQRTLADVLPPEVGPIPVFQFIDTAGKGFDEAVRQTSESTLNEGEADLVLAWAQRLLSLGLNPSELALITPYAAQAALLRERFPDDSVEIDSIDAFQGREKDAVLLSLVRSNPEQSVGFLADLRRINVAITRARRHLFIVGDSATLTGHPFYARLIDHAQATGAYTTAWEWTPDTYPRSPEIVAG